MKTLSFFLFSLLLFFTTCTNTHHLSAEVCEAESEEPNHYTEYEGTVSLQQDSVSIYLEHSDQPERNEFIDIRWSIGEHIYFVSEKYEFDKWDSEVWGSGNCRMWDNGGKEEVTKNGVTFLYFEPADGFWECMERENYHPGDEIFHFHLMAREKG